MLLEDVTVVIVPGLREHVPEHWQTLLAPRLPRSRTVDPILRDKLGRAARVAALQATLSDIEGPVIIVAHSAGVMITAHWAAQHRREIHGALLVTPADLERKLPAGYPDRQTLADNGWLPIPRGRLPFPSIVAASRNDPLGSFERVAQLAADWKSDLHDAGSVGHLNPQAGYGEWLPALGLIERICSA